MSTYFFSKEEKLAIIKFYHEEREHLCHHVEVKEIYAKRKETIERIFADAKEKHGMCWTSLRGLKKLSMQAILTFFNKFRKHCLFGHGRLSNMKSSCREDSHLKRREKLDPNISLKITK